MKRCFFIAPIGSPNSEVRSRTESLWESIVKPACEELGYTVLRADLVVGTGSITQDILTALIESELVIADISNSNPNVMYELGVRHTLAKPVVVLTADPSSIPFDIASYRTIVYNLDSLKDARFTSEAIKLVINKIEKEELSSSTPFLDAIQSKILNEIGKDGGKDLYGQIGPLLRSISERVSSVEGTLNKLANEIPKRKDDTKYTRDIFIVHGHDGELKNELARFLQKLEFNPIILHEQPDRGQSILQKLQYEGEKVGYAFILHTPDDEGRKKTSDEAQLNLRSRQNVVFEHGMFVGQFTHNRVCAIVKEGVEIPSDLSGVVYKKVSNEGGINSIAFELVAELRAADYIVDANKLLA